MSSFDSLPCRLFMDSCTAQMLGGYGGYVFEGEPIADDDRINRVTNGRANLDALARIFHIGERAPFEWIVSEGSLAEARDKNDRYHLQWLYDIADHTEACLMDDSPTVESEKLAARLDEPKFGYLGAKDRLLIKDAVALKCDAFLTVEARLPRNYAHIHKELGLQIITPIQFWEKLEPWARLWM